MPGTSGSARAHFEFSCSARTFSLNWLIRSSSAPLRISMSPRSTSSAVSFDCTSTTCAPSASR